MEIKIGRYTVCSDKFNVWIVTESKTKSKKAKKEVSEERVAGYSQDWQMLLESFMQNHYRNSDAKTVEKLLRDMNTIERNLKKIIKETDKEVAKILMSQ